MHQCKRSLELSGEEVSGEDIPKALDLSLDLSGEELSGEELSGEELSGEELSGEEVSGEDIPKASPGKAQMKRWLSHCTAHCFLAFSYHS